MKSNLPKDQIVGYAEEALGKARVTDRLKRVLLGRIERGLEAYAGETVTPEFAYDFLYALRHLVQHGLEHYGARPGRKFDPVDIETFVCSSNYMDQKAFVRPAILDNLKKIFEEESYFYEVVLGGGIGVGKNYLADMALSYTAYDLSSYYSPQVEFGLDPGANIVFMLQSASTKLARRVMLSQLSERIVLSPYFKNNFMFDTKVRTELRFPQGIVFLPISSTDIAALGMNIFGGAIDEMSFMARIKGSKKADASSHIYDQAEKLYNTVMRRMESRFILHGKVPGKLFLLGSANYPGDFIDKKMKEAEALIAEKKPCPIYVMNMALWESLPPERLSKETFCIELPNEETQGRMLDNEDEAVAGAECIHVPVDFKARFERDFDGSLRDVAGIPVGKVGKFIRDTRRINLAASKHRELFEGSQLFNAETVDQRRYRDLGDIINYEYINEYLDRNTRMGGHVDLSLTGDYCGVAIGRVLGFSVMNRTEVHAGITLPVFCIDGVMAIVPPPNGEIDLSKVRDLLLALKDMINLIFVNLDSYESAMMMQSFRRNGISSQVQSVDRDIKPYKDLKTAVLEERLILAPGSRVLTEVRDLVYSPQDDKIDHPPGGSKDIADCVAGVVHRMSTRRDTYRRGSGERTIRPRVGARPKATRPDASERRVRVGSII